MGDLERQCRAHSKQTGERCRKLPMQGADVCLAHGGRSPQVRAASAKKIALRAAEDAVATFGLPRDVGPATALLEEVHRTAGAVAWLEAKIRSLNMDELTSLETVETRTGFMEGVTTTVTAAPSVWLSIYQAERKHLVAVCGAALKAGVDERRVKLAEDQGALLADTIKAIFADLDLTPDQAAKAPGIASRHLRAVAALEDGVHVHSPGFGEHDGA